MEILDRHPISVSVLRQIRSKRRSASERGSGPSHDASAAIAYPVAFSSVLLRSVALRSPKVVAEFRATPKSMLEGPFQKMRQAARASKSTRIARRFAADTTVRVPSPLSRLTVRVPRVAFPSVASPSSVASPQFHVASGRVGLTEVASIALSKLRQSPPPNGQHFH